MENKFAYDALIVGSGAAGFAAAVRLAQKNKNVALITEGLKMGTSRNTGSDKQTYYKLSLGNETDSIRQMAQDLFSCGCVDGDTALTEAACSARCFLWLAELGVPFPQTEYGEYVGYKTDHDPGARASSAGPLTSKYMTEVLERETLKNGVQVFNGYYVTELLTADDCVYGAAAIRCETGEFAAFYAKNVILATGGPAGIYSRSVYPDSQRGAASLALNAGILFHNLTEWQYGPASVHPRWNVSGSYMQVLPRMISLDKNGVEREFLLDYFTTPADALAAVFLKGYQWPFDSKKAATGSSRVDLALYNETVKLGRHVYLDYRTNPFGFTDFYSLPLSDETDRYLQNANAAANTPIARLKLLNAPAAALYASKGVDLETQPLEIALCAQHCNGGIAVDAHWRTSLPGLYAVGECAGTHGITRPGGSALNAGQVGALRAAEHICTEHRQAVAPAVFEAGSRTAKKQHSNLLKAIAGTENTIPQRTAYARERFDAVCGAIRDVSAFNSLALEIKETLKNLPETCRIPSPAHLADYYRLRDALTVQLAMLRACMHFYQSTGGSRGGAIYRKNEKAAPVLSGDAERKDRIQQMRQKDGEYIFDFRQVRPIPPQETSFELMWKQYRARIRKEEKDM